MSDPMSSAEIEDVLRSIRRLVSDDLRPASAPEAADPVRSAPEPVPQDKLLLLTPQLRVVAPLDAPETEPVQAEDGAPEVVGAGETAEAVQPAAEETWVEEANWVQDPVAPLDWSEDAALVGAEPDMLFPADEPMAFHPAPAPSDIEAQGAPEAAEVSDDPLDMTLPIAPGAEAAPGADHGTEAFQSGHDAFDLAPGADALDAPATMGEEAADLPADQTGTLTLHRFTLMGAAPATPAADFAADALPDDLPETLAQAMAEETILPATDPMPWDASLAAAGPYFDDFAPEAIAPADLAASDERVGDDVVGDAGVEEVGVEEVGVEEVVGEAVAAASTEAEAEDMLDLAADAPAAMEALPPSDQAEPEPQPDEVMVQPEAAEDAAIDPPDMEAWADQAAAEAIAGLALESVAMEAVARAKAASAVPLADAPTGSADPEEDITAPEEDLAEDQADLRALDAEAEVTYDEDLLRDLVRDILREELAGPLGEKITRNVRKLVRAEIAQALAARELD